MKNHFAPKFANKKWAINGQYMHYYKSGFSGDVVVKPKGWKSWGSRKNLWSKFVEKELSKDLEDEAAIIYQKLIKFKELNQEERMKWAQFILSQLVRTPSFIKYEKYAKESLFSPIETHLDHDRVGCEQCGDLYWISQRNWLLIVLKEDFEFVRAASPVFATGFIDRPASSIFYPLTPRLLWVARSMPEGWKPDWQLGHIGSYHGKEQSNPFSYLLNFYLIRSSNEFIARSSQNSEILKKIAEGTLGAFPLPPFSLHILENETEDKAFESIKIIMSLCDGINYPDWYNSDMELLESC